MACQCINIVPPSFQIKGDENRQELLNLGALEPLLKLVLSEDKVVRRNSTMCLGTMAQNGEWNCFSSFSNSGDSMVCGLRLAFQAFPVQVGLCVYQQELFSDNYMEMSRKCPRAIAIANYCGYKLLFAKC